jgi:type II secretion system protein J
MKRSDSGFTLLEVIVTFAILAGVMAMMGGVLVATTNAHKIIQSNVDQPRTALLLLRQIQSDLSMAILPNPDEQQFLGDDFRVASANGNRIDFITTAFAFDVGEEENADVDEDYRGDAEQIPVPSSVNEVGYLAKEHKEIDGLMILYRREDTFIDDLPLKGGNLIPLSDRVTEFKLEYYNGHDWLPTWDNTQDEIYRMKDDGTEETLEQQMPLAVRATITLAHSADVTAGKPIEEMNLKTYAVVIPILQ